MTDLCVCACVCEKVWMFQDKTDLQRLETRSGFCNLSQQTICVLLCLTVRATLEKTAVAVVTVEFCSTFYKNELIGLNLIFLPLSVSETKSFFFSYQTFVHVQSLTMWPLCLSSTLCVWWTCSQYNIELLHYGRVAPRTIDVEVSTPLSRL